MNEQMKRVKWSAPIPNHFLPRSWGRGLLIIPLAWGRERKACRWRRGEVGRAGPTIEDEKRF